MERKKERDRTLKDDLQLLPEGHREEFYFGIPTAEALGTVIFDEKKTKKPET